MPHSSLEASNRYKAERLARLRQTWLTENGPCAYCGSADNLEVDHIDPTTKSPLLKEVVGVRRKKNLWTFSQADREQELAKCQVLCSACHAVKSNKERTKEVCKNGHAMTPDNIYSHKGRARVCRACMLADNVKRKIRARATYRAKRNLITEPRLVEFE